MKKIYLNSFICLLMMILFASASSALMVSLSTKDLTMGSEMVIMGEVETVESLWSDDKEFIFTRSTVFVDEIIKGVYLRKNIIVEYLGGEVGDIGMGVSDSPQLTEGEEVILFLNSSPSMKIRYFKPVYKIFGAAQGKYTVDYDGIAHKSGFSILRSDEADNNIDNNIPVDELIDKIIIFSK